jgi:porphobilinogen synthase
LEVIALLRQRTLLPIAAYQVSGEYALIKFAAASGAVEEARVVREPLAPSSAPGSDLFRHRYRATRILRTGDMT